MRRPAELLEEGGLDRDFKEMVEEAVPGEQRGDGPHLAEELKILLLPKRPQR